MDLIIWRHAEAEDARPDLERRLTARGHKNAARVAEWLLQRLPAKFTVIASPAERARQTAQALGVSFKVSDALLPGASPDAVLTAVDWPNRGRTVIVVGHQPTLGQVAAYLVSGAPTDWTIKKGGLWWLTDRERNDEAQVVVRSVVSPDLL